MPTTIHETDSTGQERACYVASDSGGVASREKGRDEGAGMAMESPGRVDVIVSFFRQFSFTGGLVGVVIKGKGEPMGKSWGGGRRQSGALVEWQARYRRP